MGTRCADHVTPLYPQKVGTNFADRRQPLCRVFTPRVTVMFQSPSQRNVTMAQQEQHCRFLQNRFKSTHFCHITREEITEAVDKESRNTLRFVHNYLLHGVESFLRS